MTLLSAWVRTYISARRVESGRMNPHLHPPNSAVGQGDDFPLDPAAQQSLQRVFVAARLDFEHEHAGGHGKDAHATGKGGRKDLIPRDVEFLT